MKILALTSSYPRFEGDPTAPFIESITRKVAEHGCRTDLVLPENAQWSRPASENGIHYHVCRYSPRRSWTPWGYSEALEGGVKIRRPLYAMAPVVAASMLTRSNGVAKAGCIDVVHAHWVVPNGPIAALTAARHHLPLVISLHGSDISVAQRSAWMGRAARWTFGRASAVTAPSEDLIDRARSLGATGDLEVIPYGGDPDAFRVEPSVAARVRERLGVSSSDVLVLAIGRFVHWKGFGDLVDAVRLARSSGSPVRLVLVGDGDLRDDLHAQVRSAHLEEHVSFVGMAARGDVPEYLGAADIIAVPSVHYDGYVDGLPNVALEAMAAARPVIATRVGGLPQVIRDGENGLLVDERDPVALARAIATLAGDAQQRAAIGAAGRERVRTELDWDVVADRFVQVYERACRNRRPGARTCTAGENGR